MTPSIAYCDDVMTVLSATATDVILRGYIDTEDKDGNAQTPVVIHVTRDMYHRMVSKYLDEKARYYPEFAGVGFTQVSGLTLRHDGGSHLTVYEYGADGEPISSTAINVSSYDATDFVIEMEHG